MTEKPTSKKPGQAILPVSVPDVLLPMFQNAHDYVGRYYRNRVEDPQQATIKISGERYLLLRAASLSKEFFDLIYSLYRDRGESEAREVASSFLFDMAHALGKADARNFHSKMGVTDPIAKFSAGPIHFAYSGWAFVRILPESHPSPDENFYLIYEHPFSFEADAWQSEGRRTDFPVCVMSAGYSSGWCAESFGIPLVAVEIECRAKGDENCRFIMAPPDRIEGYLAEHDAPGRLRSKESGALSIPEFFQRKRLEDELRRHRHHLEELVTERTAELRRANEKLQQTQKTEAVATLAGGIAHQFNNALASISLNLELVKMGLSDDSNVGKYLGHVKDATERMAQLTSQLLAYAQGGKYQVRTLSLSAFVSDTLPSINHAFSPSVRVDTDLPPDVSSVEGDAIQLQMVLSAVMNNASEAMEKEGHVRVSTRNVDLDEEFTKDYPDLRPGRYVCLTIEDNGKGMDEKARNRIFEPFFTTKFQGRGLGMPAVYGIIRNHGGCVSVTSEEGIGTIVRIYLPAVEIQPVKPKPGVNKPLEESGTILIIEDEEIIMEVSRALLERIGYRVLEAKTGKEAIHAVKNFDGEIDLAILDVFLPDMVGKDVYDGLVKARPRLKVIVCSGYSMDGPARDILEAGAQGFLQKPFSLAALMEKLKDLLKR